MNGVNPQKLCSYILEKKGGKYASVCYNFNAMRYSLKDENIFHFNQNTIAPLQSLCKRQNSDTKWPQSAIPKHTMNNAEVKWSRGYLHIFHYSLMNTGNDTSNHTFIS